MVVIVDYGVGNVFSLKCSLAAIGQEVLLSADPREIMAAERLILPGVGAFQDAIGKLRETGLDKVLREYVASGKPLLGICLGMQLLFDKSFEYGEHEGLGFISGEIRPIREVIPAQYKIPHMGWNVLDFVPSHPLFKYLEKGDCVYFVHSYAGFNCRETIIATTEYGCELTAAVARGNVMGCQFHPEKSGRAGLNILRAFSEMGAAKLC